MTVDVVAIGNALVDVLSHEERSFVEANGLTHGTATMVEADVAEAVYAAMGPGTEVSGGSAANTAAGIASLGGTAAFIGKVGDDQLGKVFTHDLRSAGVRFEGSRPDAERLPTGRCLVVVTDDAERTMCTYLGAATELTPADIDTELVATGAVTYLEGYLWDQPAAKDAIRVAMDAAITAGRRVAFTLSDAFCVERHRDEFVELIEQHVDVVFANEHEAAALFEAPSLADAQAELGTICEIAAITRSASGSVIVTGNESYPVEADRVDEVVDVTGAGDLYAAGFLYGLTHDHDLPTCGRLGALAAAEVITHLGARPAAALSDLAAPLLGA